MIPVIPQPEYPGFDSEVRKPGLKFLERNANPSSKEFNRHRYWTRATRHLMASYSRLCAYTSLRLIDTGSVDHFLPKSQHPYLAYEWHNYRLARQKINARKGDSERVVDPFQVESGWFVLDLPSCLIRPGDDLDKGTQESIDKTIEILQLNDDENLVQERCDLLWELATGQITLGFLDRFYPFLSVEVQRQGMKQRLGEVFKEL